MKYDYDVLIIGNGCAGLACADRLYSQNVTDICVVSENALVGTSRCSGSDKQTYYKLDIASPGGDSVRKMAEDLFGGGSVNGIDAYLEAANSLPCFMHLCELGVPFPKDGYGVYQGYRTDHDNTKRATSCGPLTSKYMTEALEKRVKENRTPVLDGLKAVKLAVKGGRCFGAYFLDGEKISLITAKYTVLCTGAPAAVYYDSVYPKGFTGATGLAIEAGAKLSNFQEWQYGIASKKFRWNLSGSYQQVIPRYFSVDADGNENEFLSDIPDCCTLIFLKGYGWPFNSAKTERESLIDIRVLEERKKGNRVYLDYTKNPAGFDFGRLGREAADYLNKAGVCGAAPIERLRQLNPAAIELFKSHRISLEAEPLEIGVCAQHNNGGIKVDENGETSVKNLFCGGEASGRFGVLRPGGAALNDTQVSALLISSFIARHPETGPCPDFKREIPLPPLSDKNTVNRLDGYFSKKMSLYGGIVRDSRQLGSLTRELKDLRDNFAVRAIIKDIKEYRSYYNLFHATLARLSLAVTMLASAEKCGSRGGAICRNESGVIPENPVMRGFVTVTDGDSVTFEEVGKIPEYDCVFEKLLSEEK